MLDLRFGSFSIQGEGPKKNECQDTLCIITPRILMENQSHKKVEETVDNVKNNYYSLGVLDGHGSSGKEASNSAADHILKFFEKNEKRINNLKTFIDREKFFTDCFKDAEKQLKHSGIDYTTSGSCAVFLFIMDNIVTVCNLGDSRAVLCRIGKEKAAIELTWDQKPTRKEEKERITQFGGKIERLNYNGEYVGPLRVWADEEGPGIAITRSLGDFQAKKIGIISEPEIDHLWIKTRDKFLVVASDGLWDVMTSAEVVGFVLKHEEDWGDPDLVSQKLCKEARTRWEDSIEKKTFSNKISDFPTARNGIDDITALIAFFDFDKNANEEESMIKDIKIV